MAEDDEDRSPGVKMQRYGGSSASDVKRSGLDCAGVCMPNFGFFSCHSKGCFQIFVLVPAIVDVVEISVAEFAMDKENLRIARQLAVLEVGGDLQSREHICHLQARI